MDSIGQTINRILTKLCRLKLESPVIMSQHVVYVYSYGQTSVLFVYFGVLDRVSASDAIKLAGSRAYDSHLPDA